jgi:hypothetical protein
LIREKVFCVQNPTDSTIHYILEKVLCDYNEEIRAQEKNAQGSKGFKRSQSHNDKVASCV